MKKTYLLLLAFLLKVLTAAAQDQHEVDSLLNRLNTAKEDIDKANVLYNLAELYANVDTQKTLIYAHQLKTLSEEKHYDKGIADAYHVLGEVEHTKGNNLVALNYFNKAINRYENLGDKNSLAKMHLFIGKIYVFLSNDVEAIKHFFKGIRFFEAIGNKTGICNAYNSIGFAYWNNHNLTEALKNFEKMASVLKEINNKQGLAAYYLNIGNVYSDMGNITTSIESYKKSLAIYETINDVDGIGVVHGSIGYTLKDIGQYEEALKHFRRSIKIYERIGNKNNLLRAYGGVGHIYIRQKKYREAYMYLNKSLALCKEVGFIEGMSIAYDYLSTLDSLTGNYKQALVHYRLSISYKDSIFNDANTKKIMQYQVQYDFEKKEAEMKFQHQLTAEQLKHQKTLTTALIIGLVALLLAAALWYQRQKQKQLEKAAAIQTDFTQQLLQNIEEERGRIAIDLHDSVSHELLTLKRSIGQDFDSQSATQKIDTIINDIRQISRNLHPVLLDKIGLKLSLETLCEQYGKNHNMLVFHEIEYQGSLSKNEELQIFRIVQEALTNTLKYAKSEASKISISQKEQVLNLEIKDNGKGFEVEKALDSGKSFGLHSILQRSKVMGGKAHIESSGQGTIININIPITKKTS